ncbi:MAG: hypothetical protein AUK44_07045 [Porphyromonadaceae bacterium CG2_30_38_12]|nr:MAG: hypothetical protein AUK44_07045 [Porphyromonadaceae bacterium CG2_30_38_12]
MAGIYIHIPFCKQRCTYCDFYTRVALHQIDDTVEALIKELELRADYLHKEPIETVYFGGGTPSLLRAKHFRAIFDTLYKLFDIHRNAEISFEANPDDLNISYLHEIKNLPFNRISIGIQSFDDSELAKIRRRHTGEQAREAFQNARHAGFTNISIDLIYGLPNQSAASWKSQLQAALNLHAEHISIYGLTYEQGTALWKQRETGKVIATDDAEMVEMHLHMLREMHKEGYEAYEISNFAKPGYRSRHNSAYWKMKPYLGVGPSAHSFDGVSRQWNVASTTHYIEALKANELLFEREVLTETNKFNEWVMVSLRTVEGIDLQNIATSFPANFKEHLLLKSAPYVANEQLVVSDSSMYLTTKGILISDSIISALFMV